LSSAFSVRKVLAAGTAPQSRWAETAGIAPLLRSTFQRSRYSAKLEEGKGINSYVFQELELEEAKDRSHIVKQLIMAVLLSWLLVAVVAVRGSSLVPRTSSSDPLASCPGYKASNVKTTGSSLTADLSLAGAACNVYGDDLKSLTLEVVYETGKLSLFAELGQLAKETQMTESTLRFKTKRIAFTKFPPVSYLGHLHQMESIPKMQTYNSTTSPRPSPSQSREPRLEKSYSILLLQVSFSRPSTFD
jgi:hypothetical protein